MQINYGVSTVEELNAAIEQVMQLMPFLIPLFLLQLAMAAVALISLSKKAVPWQDKAIWLVVILAIQNIGPIVYLIIGSKMLDDKIAKNQDNDLTTHSNMSNDKPEKRYDNDLRN